MKTFSRNEPVTIVCYGDSNTKYYLGDLQQDGPEEDSYPGRLRKLFESSGFEKVRVLNCGFPDTQTDFALANFQQQVVETGPMCVFLASVPTASASRKPIWRIIWMTWPGCFPCVSSGISSP